MLKVEIKKDEDIINVQMEGSELLAETLAVISCVYAKLKQYSEEDAEQFRSIIERAAKDPEAIGTAEEVAEND